MKSIKEKAKEVFDFPYIQDTFEEGANYVLEQLEEFLNLYGVYGMNSSAKTYLKDMIEQLKK